MRGNMGTLRLRRKGKLKGKELVDWGDRFGILLQNSSR